MTDAAAQWLTTDDLAARLAVAPRTLRKWRGQGRGPRGVALGGPNGAVRYSRADVEAWETDQREQ